jgi:hypothetical protein
MLLRCFAASSARLARGAGGIAKQRCIKTRAVLLLQVLLLLSFGSDLQS